MLNKLAASVATGLLLGASSTAMAQQTPYVVTDYQATPEIAAQVFIAVGTTLCIDGLLFLRNVGLQVFSSSNDGGTTAFVLTQSRNTHVGAILLCGRAPQ